MFSCFTGTWLARNDLFCPPPPHPKKRKKRENVKWLYCVCPHFVNVRYHLVVLSLCYKR